VSNVLAVVGRVGAKPGMFSVVSTFAQVTGPFPSAHHYYSCMLGMPLLCHVVRRAAAVELAFFHRAPCCYISLQPPLQASQQRALLC